MTLDGWIAAHARFEPRKTAIRFAGVDIGYAALAAAIDRAARALRRRHRLEPGERVAVLALNHPDLFVALFAASRLGLILVPLNWRLSVPELERTLADAAPRVLLHDAAHADTALALDAAARAADGAGFRRLRIEPTRLAAWCDGDGTADETPSDRPSTRPSTRPRAEATRASPDSDEPLLLVYTSGTTGVPRGALLSRRAVLCNALMSWHCADMAASDRVLNVLPLFHVGGINIQSLPALLKGATLVLHAGFDADRAVEAIGRERITQLLVVPTVLEMMRASRHWRPAALATLNAIAIGSTDVPRELIRAVHADGVPVIQVYGATETGPVAIYQRRVDARATEGSIGRAGLLSRIRLVDGTGADVALGEVGEILVRGDNLLSGYWRNRPSSDEYLIDGWFRTGDLASVDGDGNHWFVGRLKHVIISGGENVYPAEIERVVRRLPGIGGLSVVGIPDPRWGEVPVLVVERGEGVPDTETIRHACRAELAGYKRPAQVVRVEALPRNALGKVVVDEVRRAALAALGSGDG